MDVTKSAPSPSDCARASEGDEVTVHYGGFLKNGEKFDSRCAGMTWRVLVVDFDVLFCVCGSFDRKRPFTFTLGVGEVIPGWDQGLEGVCKGEERHLVSSL